MDEIPGFGSFNMDKIIKENNKKLHRFVDNDLMFENMIVEEVDLDVHEADELQSKAAKVLGRDQPQPEIEAITALEYQIEQKKKELSVKSSCEQSRNDFSIASLGKLPAEFDLNSIKDSVNKITSPFVVLQAENSEPNSPEAQVNSPMLISEFENKAI
jgi:hypothetical protein